MKLPAMNALWNARKNQVREIRNKFRKKSKDVQMDFREQKKHLVKKHQHRQDQSPEKLAEKLFNNVNLTPSLIRSILQEPPPSLDMLIAELEADLHSELESISHERDDAIRKFMQLCLTEL